MIQAVIFDWAGTTVDYGCMAPVAAFQQAFSEVEISLTTTQIREPMGMLKKDHIRYLLTHFAPDKYEERLVEEIYATFEMQLFQTLADYTTLKSDVLPVVQQLHQQGIKIGSTTGYTREMMLVVAHHAQLQGYTPDAIVTPDDVGNFGRPYPYMIFENMKQLQVESVAEVVKVGDTLSDIAEGLAAGVRTVGIIEGSSLLGLTEQEYLALSLDEQALCKASVRQKYLAAGADEVIETLAELLEYLTK